jgi:hypothetical protein
MKPMIRRIILALLALTMSGCSLFYDETKEKAFDRLFSAVSMNKEMKLSEITKGVTQDDINRNIKYFPIENTTNYIINTSYNFNEVLMIYNNERNEWEYIEDTAEYYTKDDVQIEHTNDQGPFYFLGIAPKINSNTKNTKMRVVVTGVIGEGTNNPQKVGAYIDTEIVIKN